MLNREYGFTKKLWWQVVPREEWKTIRLENLNSTMIKKITPKIVSKKYQKEMLESMAKEE